MLWLCILSCSLAAHAQKRVSGTVTDAGGEPVVGVNVADANALSGKMLAPAALRQQQAAMRSGVMTRSGRATDLGNGMYLGDNATDPSSVLLEVTVYADKWNSLISPGTFYNDLQYFSSLVYTRFNDDFDFVFFVLNTSSEETIINNLGFYGINMRISNDVQGLGLTAGSGASQWGSAGKLKSVMYFPFYNAILNGPTLHELCHNWAAFICPTYAPDNLRYDGHWGVSNAGGQLGGFKYVRKVENNSGGVPGKTLYQASFSSSETNADGSFKYGGFGVNANGGNGLPYSDIELYLMGMKSADELRNANFRLDIYSGNDYNYEGLRSFGDGYFYSTTVTSYTIDDIIVANGARVPDVSASQKQFKILTVALTPATATENYGAEIIQNVQWLAGPVNDPTYSGWLYNFRQATNNTGSLVVDHIKDSYTNGANVNETVDHLEISVNCSGEVLTVTSPLAESIAVYSFGGQLLFRDNKQAGAATFILPGTPEKILIVKGSSGWVKKTVR
jgi:hypothetical protein